MNRARPSVRLAAALAMLLAASGSGAPAAAATSSRAGGASVAPGDSIAARMKGVTRRDGLLATWLDRKAGRLFVELLKPSGPRNSRATIKITMISVPPMPNMAAA